MSRRSPRSRTSPSLQTALHPTSSNDPSTSPVPIPTITLSILHSHSLYIRETLLPLLSPTIPHLPPSELYKLTILLAQLSTLHSPLLTLDLLKSSRIVKALHTIVNPPPEAKGKETGRWPTDSFIQAKKILRRWERDFGNLTDLRTDLFAPGQRLHGLSPARVNRITHQSVIVPDEVIGTIWTLPPPSPTAHHLIPGHANLLPGTWYLNLAALLKENLIGHPGLGPITFDPERAYAVVLANPHSTPMSSPGTLTPEQRRSSPEWDTGEFVKFTIKGADALDIGAVKMMKTMKGDEEGTSSVRVWRHWNWGGEWAPRGGVRYDGLYDITSYSIHLSQPPNRTWHLAFTLSRTAGQFPLASVKHIPTLAQMDDWDDFLALASVYNRTDASEGPRIDQDGRASGNGGESIGLEMGRGESIQALERSVRKKVLARADTVHVIKESLLEAVKMGEDEDESDGKRDSGYFSL